MDPNACIQRCIDATSADEYADAMTDYQEWIERGGLPADSDLLERAHDHKHATQAWEIIDNYGNHDNG